MTENIPIATGGYLDSEIVAKRDETLTLIDYREPVVIACGDDRVPTSDSAELLDNTYGSTAREVSQGYARVWGGLYGAAGLVAIADGVEHGKEASTTRYGGLIGAVDSVRNVTAGRAIGHSDEGKERSTHQFRMEGSDPLGCLAANAFGGAILLMATNSYIQEVGRQDQDFAFGNDEGYDEILGAFQTTSEALADMTGGDASTFAITRQTIAANVRTYQDPVMILSGQHAPASESGAIFNFRPNMVTDPEKVLETGKTFYGVDAAVVTAELSSVLHERGISAEKFMRTAMALTTVVRAALAAHDNDPTIKGTYDPRNLALGVTGNAQEAIGHFDFYYDL